MGTGKDTTRILGGFRIDNIENIKFKNMTVTNTSEEGVGIYMKNAKVEIVDIALTGCYNCAFHILDLDSTSETTVVATRCEFANSEFGAFVSGSLTSATFKNCVFKDNSSDGIYVGTNATVHLYGEATAIHSNEANGIIAQASGKVIIHLPSHHNTSYNNEDGDRETYSGGTITNVED